MMSVTEIIARVVAALARRDADAARAAARAKAYTGPERRRAPRIAIVDDVPPAQRPADMKAAEGEP